MLGELVKYAKANGISDIPGFKAKKGKWLIVLNGDGSLIDVVEDNKRYRMCPYFEQFELVGGETKSHFLLDSLGVVANYDAKDKDDIKHEYFKKLLCEAVKYESSLKACIAFISSRDELALLHEKLKANKAKGIDNATFSVNGISVVETTGWHYWWIDYRKHINVKKEIYAPMMCFVNGELSEPTTNHFKVTGLQVVGGQSCGTTLISFDKDSFTSYNLPQSLNASCSEKVVAAYRNALDDLIEKAPRPICDSLFLHWYKEPLPAEDDIFELGWEENIETEHENAARKVERIFDAVIKGERPKLTNNTYYILQVSGAGGRIMVRDWLTGDFKGLVGNIKQWFDDISIIEPHGNFISNDFKFSAAMLRLISYRSNEGIKDSFKRIKKELTSLEPHIWRCIIENKALPDTVASKALNHISSKLLNSESSLDENLDRIACALLKIYIIRIQKLKGGNEIMKLILNQDNPSAAYQAGRLLAVLASIQQSALGDVNAGLVQRYYTSASTTPKLVIGRLIQMSQHHLDKLGKDSKGLAIWYEQQLADIMARIEINMIPKVLDLEGQTLFALGYYQQKAHMHSGKTIQENDENKGGISNGN